MVVGQEQEDGLYRPIAYVVANTTDIDKSVLVDELKALCKKTLSKWEYPHFIYFVDNIPRTVTGKKQRYLLLEEMSFVNVNRESVL